MSPQELSLPMIRSPLFVSFYTAFFQFLGPRPRSTATTLGLERSTKIVDDGSMEVEIKPRQRSWRVGLAGLVAALSVSIATAAFLAVAGVSAESAVAAGVANSAVVASMIRAVAELAKLPADHSQL